MSLKFALTLSLLITSIVGLSNQSNVGRSPAIASQSLESNINTYLVSLK